jgi:hypothetical protein
MNLRVAALLLILSIVSLAMDVKPFRASNPDMQRAWSNDTFTANWYFNNDDMRVTLYEKRHGFPKRRQLIGKLLLEGLASGQIAEIKRINEDRLWFSMQGVQFLVNEKVVAKDVTFSRKISECPRW